MELGPGSVLSPLGFQTRYVSSEGVITSELWREDWISGRLEVTTLVVKQLGPHLILIESRGWDGAGP